jgi:hypothetical protein
VKSPAGWKKACDPIRSLCAFTLDFIGRLYPKAKEVKVTDYSDLSLLEEIHKSGFGEKLLFTDVDRGASLFGRGQ